MSNGGEIIVDPDDYDDTIHVACPECRLSGDVPAEWKGQTLECKDCGKWFPVEKNPEDN